MKFSERNGGITEHNTIENQVLLVEKACNDKCYPPAKLYPNDFNEKSVLII